MAKAYTDIHQSKKLAEILPIESADMHYATWTILDGEFIVSPNQGSTIKSLQEDYGNQIIPCWSLAVLLEIIRGKVGYDLSVWDEGYSVGIYDLESGNVMTELYSNPVDAIVGTIYKLKEKDLL